MPRKRTVPRTLFVSRPLENAAEFIAWAQGQGFGTTLPAGDIHCTIAFSKTPLKWPTAHVDQVVVRAQDNRSVEALGDKGAVVLRFESNLLTARWKELLEAGASYDFDSYKPHITISWDAADVDLSEVEPFTGELVFGPEIFREIDEDWADNVTEKGMKNFNKAAVCKVDDSLGIVFGWALVSKVDGEDYFDLQGDHVPEEAMLEAAVDFMANSRVAGDMHSGYDTEVKNADGTTAPARAIKVAGSVVFAWPMTAEIAAAMGIETTKTGLMIGMKPADDEMLKRFKDGTYTGFSIGGFRIEDEEIADAA